MNQTWTKLLPNFIRTTLEGSPNLPKIISNTGWLFADKILRMGVGLFVGVWVARYLGPEQFGIYNYALAFVALFSAFATLGLDSIVVRDIVRDPTSTNETLGTAFVLKLIGGVLTIAFTVGTIILMRSKDSLTCWMVGVIAAGMVFQAFNAIDLWFRSQVKSKYTIYAKSSAFLMVSVGKIGLILLRAPLIAFAWAGFAEIAIGAIGMVFSYWVNGHVLRKWRSSLPRARKLLRDSLPLMLSGIVIIIYMRIDQVMLGELASNKDVGNYSAAVRLVEVWYFLPMALTTSLFPTIINLKKLSPDVYEARIQRLYDLMIWMAIGLALIISVFSQQIVAFLFGNKYRAAAFVLSLHAWMTTAVFFGVSRQKWLIAEGYLKETLYLEVSAAILNVGSNLILIPMYGAVGAALASLITAFGANLTVAIYSKPIRHSMKMYLVSLLLPVRFIRRKICAA